MPQFKADQEADRPRESVPGHPSETTYTHITSSPIFHFSVGYFSWLCRRRRVRASRNQVNYFTQHLMCFPPLPLFSGFKLRRIRKPSSGCWIDSIRLTFPTRLQSFLNVIHLFGIRFGRSDRDSIKEERRYFFKRSIILV